ncbi:hypothetical protein ACWDA3_13780 [Nonomuraea rubra]
MPEPRQIKDGCLQGGNPALYGDRDAIKAQIMATGPEKFGPAVEGYQATARLLTTAITTLGDSAARLVADGNWGGESARAMLTRMNRLQAYLQSLRDAVNLVPPSLETVSQALASAKERFEQETEPRNYYAMGSGSPDNGDGRAREFMTRLNGAFHNAHTMLPDRLPWDARLASPAPYLPPPERAATPVQGGDLPYEDTVPARSAATRLAQSSGYEAATAPAQPGPQVSNPVQQPPTSGTPAPAVTAGTGQLSSITPSQAGTSGTTPGNVPGTYPGPGRPAARPNAFTPVPAARPNALTPVPPPASTTRPAPTGKPIGTPTVPETAPVVSPIRDPYTASAAQGPGPSVRPGSVPVVDGSWTRPLTAAAEPAAPGTGGMPFMPWGGAAPQDAQSTRHPAAARSADDFFRPEIDPGIPVVE